MKFTHQMWHRKDFGYQNVCKHQISVDYRLIATRRFDYQMMAVGNDYCGLSVI